MPNNNNNDKNGHLKHRKETDKVVSKKKAKEDEGLLPTSPGQGDLMPLHYEHLTRTVTKNNNTNNNNNNINDDNNNLDKNGNKA